MNRWLTIALAVLAGVVVLLGLNAIAVSNETKDAERNIEDSELIDTGPGTLQALEEGNPQGPPIVLIHGYASSMRWFERLVPLLEEGHRVIRVDLLGHGGSDKPSSGYGMENQAQAVAEALARLDVAGATVVGHSMGATVATALAEQSPELAVKVVNVDQAPDESFEDMSLSARLARWPVLGQALRRLVQAAPSSAVRAQYDQAFAPGFNVASGFENPDQPVDDLRAMTYTAYVESSDAEGDYSAERPLDERLAALGVPLLVVFGTEDQIYPAPEAAAAFEDVPGAQVQLLEGAGHSPNVEAPEQLAPLISAFAAAPLPGEEPPPKRNRRKKGR